MWFGFYGNLDVAVVEVTAILPDGLLVGARCHLDPLRLVPTAGPPFAR